MADDTSGEKTEKPTPKKLRDARKQGDVPKSRDLGLAMGLAVSLLLMWQLVRVGPPRLMAVMDTILNVPPDQAFLESLSIIGVEAVVAALLLSALILLPTAIVSLLVEFIQVGPILTTEKLIPRLSNLDPIAGFRRMFSADSLVASVKAVLLTLCLFGIAAYVIVVSLAELLLSSYAAPMVFGAAILDASLTMFLWTLAAFAFFTAIDIVWQHHSFEKKMMMSHQDIKDEHKNMEGDPQMKSERKRLAKKWAGEGARKSAAKASVLIVNPIHVAVAVLYDEKQAPVPKVIGRGEEALASDMRHAAEEAGVPVLRNELLARTLLKDTSDGDLVPRELFAVIAEVTLWALRVRERIDCERRGEASPVDAQSLPVPGEDLTRYGTSEWTST